MNEKKEFKIQEVMFSDGKHCYIYEKKFNIFGKGKWVLMDTDMNNGQFITSEQAIEWLNNHQRQKEFKPFVINETIVHL